jgi:hypothetical protein
MPKYYIHKCLECEELLRVYEWQDYQGDPRYCPACNVKSGETFYTPEMTRTEPEKENR